MENRFPLTPKERRLRPHEKGPCPYPIVPVEQVIHYDIPQTEEEWERVSKIKKIDANDLVHQLGPDGFRRWLDESPTYVIKWDDSEVVSGRDLMITYPKMREPVIHGLLRRSETMNIIAAPKSSKSWLGMNMAMNIIGGGQFFGRFQCERGKVLIVDNELHCETIAQRLRDVAPALNVPTDRAGRLIDFLPLRGRLTSIDQLGHKLKGVHRRTYNVIILDAFYKFYPENFDENDNAAMARLYTHLDDLAEELDAALVLVHHSSKGNSSSKSVTDMGAGAGSQSRACDAHLVLREHQEPGVFVIDSVNRSFPKIEKFCARFKWPKWEEASGLDPEELKAPEGKKKDSGFGSMKVGGDGSAKRMTREEKKLDERRRVEEFMRSEIKTPAMIQDIIAKGQGKGFFPWNRDRLKVLIPELIRMGILKLDKEAKGPHGATYVAVESQQPALPPPESSSNYDDKLNDYDNPMLDSEEDFGGENDE